MIDEIVSLTIYLRKSNKDELKQLCKLNEISMNDFCRNAIRKEIKIQKEILNI